MTRPLLQLTLCLILLAVCPATADEVDHSELERQVEAVERAFARSMADRDFEAFKAFLSEEAVFLSGDEVRRGREAVAERWAAYFDEPEAPFSWEPGIVEVLDSGKLALSTGPVYGSNGNRFSTFTSVWRQEEPGVWRIVFDKGDRYCE